MIADLQSRFAIPGIADVVEGRGGLPAVRVTSPLARGEMYLHGAHVTSWKQTGAGEVLFVSDEARWQDGRAIRGGVPVCFPWFSARASDPGAPAHGFVRTTSWQLESIADDNGAVTVTMATGSDAETDRWWPAGFRLLHRATFADALTLELVVTNTGRVPLRFEEALHTYYAVGHIGEVRVAGLDGMRYLDTVGAVQERTQHGDVTFDGETDRVYLNTGAPITIADRALRRRITISTDQARTAVVWNPWTAKAQALSDLGNDEWLRFVCVETSNVATFAVELGPQQSHAMRMHVTAEPTG